MYIILDRRGYARALEQTLWALCCWWKDPCETNLPNIPYVTCVVGERILGEINSEQTLRTLCCPWKDPQKSEQDPVRGNPAGGDRPQTQHYSRDRKMHVPLVACSWIKRCRKKWTRPSSHNCNQDILPNQCLPFPKRDQQV
jgi:hypothetical protein